MPSCTPCVETLYVAFSFWSGGLHYTLKILSHIVVLLYHLNVYQFILKEELLKVSISHG